MQITLLTSLLLLSASTIAAGLVDVFEAFAVFLALSYFAVGAVDVVQTAAIVELFGGEFRY